MINLVGNLKNPLMEINLYFYYFLDIKCSYLIIPLSIPSTAKFESKHSSSIDSIDASPNLEHHRRSKSILKNKSDVSRVLSDPESERLLADNMSGSGVSDNGTVMVCTLYLEYL